jgi:hypothetical protein
LEGRIEEGGVDPRGSRTTDAWALQERLWLRSISYWLLSYSRSYSMKWYSHSKRSVGTLGYRDWGIETGVSRLGYRDWDIEYENAYRVAEYEQSEQ